MAEMRRDPQVDALMAAQNHPFDAEILALREIILAATTELRERVKWNAPSYHLGKVDMAAFNLRAKGFVQLIFVFPKGLMLHESQGLLQGTWEDRREARFQDLADIAAQQQALTQVVRDWVALIASA